MSKIAVPFATGPFHGFFHEGATLYRLDPLCLAGGPTKRNGIQTREISHIIVSGMPADEYGNGPETVVFAADESGVVDSDYYLTFGAVLDLDGIADHDAALARLGYGA